MPQCSKCSHKQARLNDGDLCTSCYRNDNNTDLNGSQMSHFGPTNTGLFNESFPSSQSGQNSPYFSLQNSMFGGTLIRPSVQQQNQAGASSYNLPSSHAPYGNPRFSAAAPAASTITPGNLDGLMSKPISDLTVADIIQINRISNEPIRQQLNTIETEMRKKIQSLDNRITILEKQNTSTEEENEVLRKTISNMQRCLNKIDSDVRNKNVIITGLPEGDIEITDHPTLQTDVQKVKWILKITGNDYFDGRTDDFEMSRLGEVKRGFNRALKIVLADMTERNKFLKDTIKMKDAPAPWNKVFVKKDQHSVYLDKNKRLRIKKNELKKKSGYENKEIQIVNSQLLVDNVSIDRNLFFH